jgi:hypothetical protein
VRSCHERRAYARGGPAPRPYRSGEPGSAPSGNSTWLAVLLPLPLAPEPAINERIDGTLLVRLVVALILTVTGVHSIPFSTTYLGPSGL